MKHFQDDIHYIPGHLDVYSDEYEKWKEEFQDICETALRFEPDSDIHASAKLLSFLCKKVLTKLVY